MPDILIIDDEIETLDLIASILEAQGYNVRTADGGEKGVAELESHFFDLVITDLKMPYMDGMAVLEHVIERCPDTLCVILTGYGTIQSSVEAIKKGAFDYITKPVRTAELLTLVKKAITFKELQQENLRLKKALKQEFGFSNIVGTSPPIVKIYDIIKKVADTDGTVLITGPSGTGKELIAKALHYNSSRCDRPLVVINCGAIPEELLESEIFGHEKGAFTGAHKSRMGRFEMAHGGTIFLDEIGEMSPALQVKLLRVLQEQRFERVGGTKTIDVDVRIIAATNKDLEKEIQKGRFREDLYYRLNVIPIEVPSLSERAGDIPLLASYFLDRFQKGKKKRIRGFTPLATRALMGYSWPGNVRELENLVKRLTILCEGRIIDIEDLPEKFKVQLEIRSKDIDTGPGFEVDLNRAVREYEKELVYKALKEANYVKSKAARLLKIKRTTLVEKLKKMERA